MLVNAAEVLYKPRCQLANRCLLCIPFSTSVLQHGGSFHSNGLAIAGQMHYAMTSNGKYSTEEAACMLQNAAGDRYEECAAAGMLQNAAGDRCEECAAAWPLQYHYS